MARDYYQILGVDRSASEADIKKTYRKLSKELHPDKNKGDKEKERQYKEVNEAYEVLRDPKKKKQYDQFGTASSPSGGFNGAGFDFSGFQSGEFGGFSDIFETFFGGGRGGAARAQRQSRGQDLQTEITVDLLDIVKGVTRKIGLRTQITCEECTGSGTAKGTSLITCEECGGTGQITRTAQSMFGTIQQSMVCPVCQGKGQVPEKPCGQCGGQGRTAGKRDVSVTVPPGIHDGQTLRLRDEGEAGRQDESPGDLFVIVHVKPDSRFTRDGDDVRTILTLPVIDVILGTTAKVETVHGVIELKIPDGTQPGQVFRIKGKGLPVLNASRQGDHYVEVEVEIPKKLSRKVRGILEEWKKNS